MQSIRAKLTTGMVIANRSGLTPYRVLRHVDSEYSESTYKLINTLTGRTLIAHGVNLYPDGLYDWDFSTNVHFQSLEEVI